MEAFMKTKKHAIVVATTAVIALSAVAIIISWLNANLPAGNNSTPQTTPSPEENTYATPTPQANEEPNLDNGYPANEDYIYGEPEEDETTGYEYNEDPQEPYHPEPEPPVTPIFTREPLPENIISQITGVTFHDNTPFDYSFLTYVTVTHVNFYGESIIGHLIVADEIGDEVLEIFKEIYESGFPIHSIRLIDYFNASDYESMAANNSHAFNFRYIAGTNVISRHGFGMAIDINPVQNPYYRNGVIWPAIGEPYLDRSYIRPGMIIPGDAVYTAFMSRGWTWGGNWTSPRDYHHFERRQ